MCLPEYASKRKKYSSTAGGPPPLMQRRSLKTKEQKNKKTQTKGAQRRCAPTANNRHAQCRGRPMCLPEYASKRKKYSSTASGPTGSNAEEEFERQEE